MLCYASKWSFVHSTYVRWARRRRWWWRLSRIAKERKKRVKKEKEIEKRMMHSREEKESERGKMFTLRVANWTRECWQLNPFQSSLTRRLDLLLSFSRALPSLPYTILQQLSWHSITWARHMHVYARMYTWTEMDGYKNWRSLVRWFLSPLIAMTSALLLLTWNGARMRKKRGTKKSPDSGVSCAGGQRKVCTNVPVHARKTEFHCRKLRISLTFFLLPWPP